MKGKEIIGMRDVEKKDTKEDMQTLIGSGDMIIVDHLGRVHLVMIPTGGDTTQDHDLIALTGNISVI